MTAAPRGWPRVPRGQRCLAVEGTLTDSRLRALFEAGLVLTSVQRRLLEAAAELTGARYAALGVIDPSGSRLERFLTHGIDPEALAPVLLGVLTYRLFSFWLPTLPGLVSLARAPWLGRDLETSTAGRRLR